MDLVFHYDIFSIYLEEISSHFTNSHELVGVADEGGVPGLGLLLSGHLILLCLVAVSVLFLAVVAAAGHPEPEAHFFLLLRGNHGADGARPGIVPILLELGLLFM